MADENINIRLSDTSLNIQDCLDFVKSNRAGAQCLFTGTVRNHSGNKAVKYLEYSSYKPMAISEMKKIADQCLKNWPVCKISIHHRTGHLSIGETAVIIAVSSAHRKEAFEACQWTMDTVKKQVPIWKKEVYDGGEEWVGAM